MKRIELNTNEQSKEPIWIAAKVAEMYYNHNDRETHNSFEATYKFLKEAEEKAKKEGFIQVRVQPTYTEPSEDSLGNEYIRVMGYRLETNAETRRRLQSFYTRNKMVAEQAISNGNHYASKAFYDSQKELKDVIDKL